jgi:hypothetical protein
MLLGHSRIETTAMYTQVSAGLIARTESPLDVLPRPAKPKRRIKSVINVPSRKTLVPRNKQPKK